MGGRDWGRGSTPGVRGPPQGSLATYWYRVHLGGLCGPGSTRYDTGRRVSQWCWSGCWLGKAGRIPPQTGA